MIDFITCRTCLEEVPLGYMGKIPQRCPRCSGLMKRRVSKKENWCWNDANTYIFHRPKPRTEALDRSAQGRKLGHGFAMMKGEYCA